MVKLRFLGGFRIGPKPEIFPAFFHLIREIQIVQPVVYPLRPHLRQPFRMILIESTAGDGFDDQIPEKLEGILLQSGIHMGLTEGLQIL